MRELTLDLGERSYPIRIAPNLLSDNDWPSFIKGKQACVVTNETIAPLYLEAVLARLQGWQVSVVVLPDGESHKNLETLNTIFDQLLEDNHTRKTTLIALGGGVVGDMTGFAAACYQRGVPFIQLPTTLLSMVDSSVGGKTGVNHALGKNMIGAFYQPECVIIDTETLTTLPPREFSAGLAEVLKYGLIADVPFYDWLEANWDGLLARDPELLAEAILCSCENKARVVAEDEREGGRRAILNLGHTFGHAIETATGYGSWLHGEAVATGMLIAAKLSSDLGWIADAEVERLASLLQRADLPLNPPAEMAAEQFLSLMARDKKVLDGRLRLVLLKALGEAVVTDEVEQAKVIAAIEAVR
ncbi:3-dehydroquinate synthase [Litorivivens lipolytica]|uniref:3-dehydroquinate synthase n=1 Tax=Litorivivens lipolytica TaxID=1524264 RepID=A0A7W4Z635_9GAMM|nr:3-dehydroquinate synthase [Litorivivens lipolytica]MBB3047777.1 3-dehydroquinate synthase [Litorivivens lipolytica]